MKHLKVKDLLNRNDKVKNLKKSEKLTLIVVPQTAGKTYKLNISTLTIKSLLITALILILITIGICLAFYNSRVEIKAVKDLKEDNLQKIETIKILNAELEAIENQKKEITKKQNEIKKLMGIKENSSVDIQPKSGGKGGEDINSQPFIETEGNMLNRVQEIKTYLDRQEQELDMLLAQVDNRTEYFRSIPNQWPVKGEITSPYGWRKSPFGSSQTFHDGIDIANDVGTDIVAAADGKVIFSGWQPVYGRTIVIDHGYNFTTKYGHNSALLVEEGDLVRKGEVIARLGNTGRSTGPHLHFTVTKGGNTQDPLIYLP